MQPNEANFVMGNQKKNDDLSQERLFYIYLNEYLKLKDEQIKRMGFRDNLLYVTLVTLGGIVSFAITDLTNRYYTFLVLPWVCIILGWTYLINDEKISAIGRYIRLTLTEKLGKFIHTHPEPLFGWEIAHRSDNWRKSRKLFQLVIDETTFCLSGFTALLSFNFLAVEQLAWYIYLIWLIELILLGLLSIWIVIYADLKKGL